MVKKSRKSPDLKKKAFQYRIHRNPSDLSVEGERIDRFLFWKSEEKLEDLWEELIFHFSCSWLCFDSFTNILCDFGQVCFGEIVVMVHLGNEEKECGTASSDFVIQYNCL